MSNKVDEIREQMGKLHKKYNPFTDFNFENDLSIEEYVYHLGDWFKGLLDQFKSLEDTATDAVTESAENAEDAATSATAAAISATAAAGSAEAAADSAEDAKNYADNIANPVSGLVTSWLEKNITEDPNVIIDASLSVSGAAADAKITGDSALKKETINLSNDNLSPWRIRDSTNLMVRAENTLSFASSIIPVIPGQIITMSTSYQWGSYYAFLQDINFVVGTAPNWAAGYSSIRTLTQNVEVTETAPNDAYYLIIRNDNQSTNFTIKSVLYSTARLNEIDKNISVLNDEVTDVKDISVANRIYWYINEQDNAKMVYSSSGNSGSSLIPVIPGEKISFSTSYQWGTTYAFLRDSNFSVGTAPNFATGYSNAITVQQYKTVIATTPEDANYLILRNDNISNTFTVKSIKTPYVDIVELYKQIKPFSIPQSYRALMFAFNNNEHELQVLGTNNFKHFTKYGNLFHPSKGHSSCRDPYGFVYNEWFYIIYTDALNWQDPNNSIGICRTKDFINYEEFTPLVLKESAVICWAPSIFFENGQYYLTATISTTSASDPHTYLYDFDVDTLEVSNERELTIDTITKPLDMQIYKFNGTYYLVGKNESSSGSVIAKSTTLNGPYSVIMNTAVTSAAEEGQELIRLDNGKFRLYVNHFVSPVYYAYVDFSDIEHPEVDMTEPVQITYDGWNSTIFHSSIYDFVKPYGFENV